MYKKKKNPKLFIRSRRSQRGGEGGGAGLVSRVAPPRPDTNAVQ